MYDMELLYCFPGAQELKFLSLLVNQFYCRDSVSLFNISPSTL